MGSVTIDFWKYQGLGNDFIVVEAEALMAAASAVRLCDRRRGIGADGVLSVLPPRAGGVAYMHIFNSDGSVAAMCGNGIRCLARFLAEQRGLTGTLAIETDAGTKRCVVHRAPGAQVESISVEMGPARWQGQERFAVEGETLVAERVSMGNPHAVIFCDPPADAPAERARRSGQRISDAVPGGVNAGFAQVRAGGIDLVVWERGAGLTEACGTGACAAAVAAVKTGRLPVGAIEVRLPGGPLIVTVAPDLVGVEMRGPAERVFAGQVELAA